MTPEQIVDTLTWWPVYLVISGAWFGAVVAFAPKSQSKRSDTTELAAHLIIALAWPFTFPAAVVIGIARLCKRPTPPSATNTGG